MIAGCTPPAGACEAAAVETWRGAQIWRFPESEARFFAVRNLSVDADGAPNAYHPDDTGLDALANAGYRAGGVDGEWRNVLVADPADPTRPWVQPTGRFAGYFLSQTALFDNTRLETDPARWVDATEVPYLVLPGGLAGAGGLGRVGDLARVIRVDGTAESSAVVADVGPRRAALGEVSLRLAGALRRAGAPAPIINPRNGAGVPSGPFIFVIFPGMRGDPAWPITADEMERRTSEAVQALGGWRRLRACVE